MKGMQLRILFKYTLATVLACFFGQAINTEMSASDFSDISCNFKLDKNKGDFKSLLTGKPVVRIDREDVSCFELSVTTDLTAADKGWQITDPPMQLGGIRVKLEGNEVVFVGFQQEFHQAKKELHLTIIRVTDKMQFSSKLTTPGASAKIEFFKNQIRVYRLNDNGGFILAKSVDLEAKKIIHIDPCALQDLNRDGVVAVKIKPLEH